MTMIDRTRSAADSHHSRVSPPVRRRPAAALVACWVAAVLAVALGAWPWAQTGVTGAGGPDGFPLARAQAALATVAAVPHPMGTDANAGVRAFLVDELRGMGLLPMVQIARVTLEPDAPNSVWTGEVNNVVARLTGSGADHSAAVLLAAHYDSVPAGPGAGDNGIGVVAALETMRVLAAGAPPRHDVIVLFTDGEEHEMLGSKAFVDEHPWAHDVRVVLNTEGAGGGGRVSPALTSPDNGWVLRQYVAASSDPFVYSAFDAPLNALHMGGDLERYQQVVPAGLEFATLGGLARYHTSLDAADRADVGTVAEYGTTILALTRRLADSDLSDVSATSAVAFTVTRQVTVIYPGSWSLPLALLAALGVLAALMLAVHRRRIRLWSVTRSLAGLGAGVVVALVLATAATWLAGLADPRMSDAVQGHSYQRIFWLLGALGFAAAAVLLAGWWLRRRHRRLELAAAALIGIGILAVLLGALAPTVAYLATWPLLAATAAFAFLAARPRPAGATRLVATAAALPALLLATPLVYAYFQVIARAEISATIPLIALPILFAALALVLVVPLVGVGLRGLSWRPAAAAALAGVALLGSGVLVDRVDQTNPRPDLLAYRLDADTGQASWLALPSTLDGYTSQVGLQWADTTFVPSPFHHPEAAVPARTTAAASLALEVPSATVLSDVVTTDRRVLRLNVVAAPGTYALTVEVRTTGAVRGLTVAGQDAPGAVSADPATVRVVEFSPTTAGTPVTVTVDSGRPVDVILTSYTLGLPPQLTTDLAPRPADRMLGVYEIPDSTIVTRTMRVFDAYRNAP